MPVKSSGPVTRMCSGSWNGPERKRMQLVEQHIIKRSDSRFAPLDAAAFKAKNLYNAALYVVRQSFLFENRYLGYEDVYHRMKGHEAYCSLPTKVAQQV